MDWFMQGIEKGLFEVRNPYNLKISRVPSRPDAVHSIVFWSKNFAPFIDGGYGQMLSRSGYHIYFQFTINCENPILEPNIPPMYERLEQAKALCRDYGPEAVCWRFDPVCVYETEKDGRSDNTYCLESLAKAVSSLGIKRCVTSFVDLYPKVMRRAEKKPGFSFFDPPVSEKREMLMSMKKILDEYGINMVTCCEKDVMENWTNEPGIKQGACIDHRILSKLYGPGLNMKKDRGQRSSKGCGCMVSKDIGSYAQHPCFHACLFCYANPAQDARKKKNEDRPALY